VPISQLKGFDRVFLNPGESGFAVIELGPDAFKLVNAQGDRQLYPGSHALWLSLGQATGAKNSLVSEKYLSFHV
jgi:hypothetical protein